MGIRPETRELMRAAFACLLLCLPNLVWAACSQDRVDLRGSWGQASFAVEVADDPDERSQGLMYRESMAKSASMLFVYQRPQQVAFWMRNTLIPLDLIFADETGTVIRVHENAIPLDETALPGGDSVQFVLEINGGMASIFGINPGTELRHPEIAAHMAAWGCQ